MDSVSRWPSVLAKEVALGMRLWPLLAVTFGALASACGASHRGPNAPTGWTEDADTVEVGARGGTADFFRTIRYSRPQRTLSVEDSDPFAGEHEKHPAQVTRKKIVLSPEDTAKVEGILGRLRPSGESLDKQCFPGGCKWISLDGDDDRLEDDDLVTPVLNDLTGFFPGVRKY